MGVGVGAYVLSCVCEDVWGFGRVVMMCFLFGVVAGSEEGEEEGDEEVCVLASCVCRCVCRCVCKYELWAYIIMRTQMGGTTNTPT